MASDNEGQPHYPYANLGSAEARLQLKSLVSGFFTKALWQHSILREQTSVFTVAAEMDGPEKTKFLIENLKVTRFSPLRQQIIAPAGMGKTTCVIENLAQCRGMTVWLMVPTRDLAKEVMAKIRRESPEVSVFFYQGRNEETCARHEIARYVGSKGLNVQSGLCGKDDDKTENKCFAYEICGYQNQRKKMKALGRLAQDAPPCVIVMSHAYLTANCGAPKPDLVIIDEKHWPSFISVTSDRGKGGKPDLTLAEIINAGESDVEGYGDYSAFVTALTEAMKTSPKTFNLHVRKNKEVCVEKALKHIGSVISKYGKPHILPNYDDNTIRAMVQNWKRLRLHLIEEMLEALTFEFDMGKGVTSVLCDPEKDTVRIHTTKQNMIPKDVPVLLIDASADYEINSRIWGYYLESFEIRAERNAEIIQVRRETFSKISLGIAYGESEIWKPKEGAMQKLDDVIAFTNEVSDRASGNIFFAASKQIVESVKGKFADNVITGHYGALRGKNIYEHCEAAIIVGREEPNYLGVEGQARALLSRHEKASIMFPQDYTADDRNRRMKDGSVEPEVVRVHFNPFVQRVLEQAREKEIEQALDRLRLMNEGVPPKKVYILTSVVIDATIDKSVTWEELKRATKMDEAIKYALMKAKAFPLGDRDIFAASPSALWSSQNAVGSYMTRRGGVKGVALLIRLHIETDPLYLVEYRRPKQKRASHAIVSANEPNPQAALETVLGCPLSAFKIVDRMNPKESQDADAPDDTPD